MMVNVTLTISNHIQYTRAEDDPDNNTIFRCFGILIIINNQATFWFLKGREEVIKRRKGGGWGREKKWSGDKHNAKGSLGRRMELLRVLRSRSSWRDQPLLCFGKEITRRKPQWGLAKRGRECHYAIRIMKTQRLHWQKSKIVWLYASTYNCRNTCTRTSKYSGPTALISINAVLYLSGTCIYCTWYSIICIVW